MPLTEGAKEVLAFVNQSSKPFDRLTVDEARESLRALCVRFSQRAEDVGTIEDAEVLYGGGSVRVRVYRPVPNPSAAPLPIVVMLHGGGWALGDLDTHDWFSRALCNAAPAVVVAAEYRRPPEHPYPAALDDVNAVVSWAARRAAWLSGPDAPLFLLGDSAGGNLAAAVSLVARDAGPAISGQVLIYPVLDARMETRSYDEFGEGFLLTREKMQWYWDLYTPDPAVRDDPLVSPLRSENLAGLPPALVVTAGCDPLRDEGELYAERLRKAGVPAAQHRFEGLLHPFALMPDVIPEARDAIEICATFIRDTTAATQAGTNAGQHRPGG